MMSSPAELVLLGACPVASTPFRTPEDPKESVTVGVSPNLNRDRDQDDSLAPLSQFHQTQRKQGKSIRHSLGHVTLRTETAKRLVWTTQRTSRLFDLLTRPALLFTPSLGISLPFNRSTTRGDWTESRSVVRLPINKRRLPIDPDPCLLSVDGLVDCLFAIGNLVDQVYYDCMDGAPEQDQNDDFDHSPTMLAANYFRKRLKPAITRLGELRLRLSDFKLGECIGRGACGIVRVVREVAPPHSVYAMKSQYKGAWLHHDPEGFQIMLERTVLAQAAAIENPWLPHLHYAFQDEKQLHLVMDYESGGDLYIFLSKVGHLLDAEMIQFYAAEAIEATHSLHQMGYIHCDLKPENFAIERSGHLKLLDFGSAIRLDADGRCVCPTMVGTKEYLNIELLRQRGRHNEEPLLVGPEYDYWAIGVLLYELFYGQTPFYDEDDDAMMKKIMNYKKSLQFPPGVDIPDEVVQLIRSLITTPSKRLTYDGLVRHPFFKNIDFSQLRQTPPPYLPPVGELDDVSNFSGGGARTRDEAILDVSTNETFSPVRMQKKSCPGSVYRSAQDVRASPASSEAQLVDLTSVENPTNTTALPGPSDPENQENVDPTADTEWQTKISPTLLTTREAKEKAIREAAAVPVHEEIEEIEDIDWHGSDCVRNLPFVGYTFTPGLVLLRNITRGQAAATVAAGLGTSMLANAGTPFRPTASIARQKLCLSRLVTPTTPTVCRPTPDNQTNRDKIKLPDVCDESEFLVKISNLQQKNEQLRQHVEYLHTQQQERAECLRQQLADVCEKTETLSEIKVGIEKLPDHILSETTDTFQKLIKRIKELQEVNASLQASTDEAKHYRTMVEKMQLIVSRLEALPDDYLEGDVTDILHLVRPTTAESKPDTCLSATTGSLVESDETDLIRNMVQLVIRQHRSAAQRIADSRAEAELARREMKEAWETSRQQTGTLDVMVADQRRARDCENLLNREIQDLKQKLADAKEYQRDLRSRCMEFEDKYFAARDRLAEQSKIMSDRLRAEQESTRMHVHLAEIERSNAEQREAQLREHIVDLENQLSSSRHDNALLRDRYDKLKEVAAHMESSMMNYHPVNTELTSVQQQLASVTQERRALADQLESLEMQLERLRVSNTQLASQRDAARQETRQLQADLLREKESNEVTQQAAQSEIFKLTTITSQQGKLIAHMCNLLPPEHRKLSAAMAETRFNTLTAARSFLDPKRSSVKLTQHGGGLKPSGYRSNKPGLSESDLGHGSSGGGPLIAAASAFFSRRRKVKNDISSDPDDMHTRPDPLVKQPSRLLTISKSRLRFRRHRNAVPVHFGEVQSAGEYDDRDDKDYNNNNELHMFTEDECTIGCYSPGSTDNGLPISVPAGTKIDEVSDTADSLSNVESISSSAPSTTSSAPASLPPKALRDRHNLWHRQSRRTKVQHVGWADAATDSQSYAPNQMTKHRSQFKLLKQLSKVLGKSKPNTTARPESGPPTP